MVQGKRVSVGTSPTALHDSRSGGALVVKPATSSVDLGDSAVATGAGYPIASTDPALNILVPAGDVVYAVAASGTVVVNVLET